MKAGLLIVLALVTIVYPIGWLLAAREARRTRDGASDPSAAGGVPSLLQIFIGFVTNFFDTLGIGSFATTTSMFKLGGLVSDELIPGTLNVGHTLPTFVEALIYVAILKVDVVTLILMIAAAVVGAWLGAGIVASWPRRNIQVGMGLALLAASALMLMKQKGWFPVGSEALGLVGLRLVLGIAGNFVLGALMTLGIGLYAPCMILVSMLGMNETTAYPIMMGSCAFLMPVASARFIRERRYDLRAALGLTVGGVFGVPIAAFIVWSLPIRAVRWLVIGVVIYTAVALLRSAQLERGRAPAASMATPPAM